MKQIVSNYSYSPTTNVVTLTGVNIDADQLLLIVAPEVGRTMYNFASVTGTVSAGVNTRVTLNASTAGLTTTSPLVIFYDDQAGAQSVTGTVALDPASLIALENVTVTVGSSVSISNFPSTQTISGTVTANVGNYSAQVTGYAGGALSTVTAMPVALVDRGVYGGGIMSYDGSNTSLNVSIKGTVPAISGTVTANAFVQSGFGLGEDIAAGMTEAGGIPISGTVTANVRFAADVGETMPPQAIALGFYSGDDAGIAAVNDSTRRLPISGTVTASAPNGSLTTRFGTPTTANTAFATSAVTNASRKYLLIQNVTTGSNVITVGIGFTPTTTQGIQLTAGAGITFESSYIPTGAVYVLSSVTASNFTVLEA
jgi:hypothetical protein